MKVPLSWLSEYVDIRIPLEDLLERLTLAGLELASVQRIGDWWDRERLVVGEVLEVRPHPNADRLVLADVAYGGPEVEQVVTGAPNLFPYKGAGPVSLKVPFAMEGAELYDGHKEGFVRTRLKGTKIRGVPSRAMVCSEKELGISEEHEGIMILPQDAPVGAPLADYLGDTIVDLDLTPNLARCFSMIGVAREVSALTGAPLRYSSTEWQADGPPAAGLAGVEIEDPQLCARYIATIIRDVEIGPSPQWMQSRLQKAGMRPISNVVDVTNYVMLEWGQPLHAFDYDKLVARAGGVPTIIVRRARPGESMTTLDGVHRVFNEDTLLITDTAGPIAVAGVMGGLDTEVDENTRNILLEAANFYFISVRRTMQAMKLPSEASQRFGRGIHPALAEPAARRASELMRVLASGTIARGMVDNYPLPPRPVVIDLTTTEVKRQLGIDFGLEEIAAYLERLEFVCEPVDGQTLRVVVPEHRLDCQLPADLVEEVARMFGYDRIPVTDLADRLPPQRSNPALAREEAVRDTLVACGLQEIVTYALVHQRQDAALAPGTRVEDLPAETYVTLANPISQDRPVMRHTLLANALDTAAANLRFHGGVELFEVGKVFLLDPGQELPREPLRLCLVLAGSRQERHWLVREQAAAEELDFFDLKGVVEALLARLHVEGAAFEPAGHPTFQPGRTARLVLKSPGGGDAAEIGVLGELHPAVREAFDLPPVRVAAADLDLDALLAHVPETWRVEAISPYPAVLQDLAVIVDEEVPAAAVQADIVQAGGFLLRDVQLFDVYRGEPVPAGKKSLAYALTFQAPDKTLRDEIVARQVKAIVRKLEQELGAEMRT